MRKTAMTFTMAMTRAYSTAEAWVCMGAALAWHCVSRRPVLVSFHAAANALAGNSGPEVVSMPVAALTSPMYR